MDVKVLIEEKQIITRISNIAKQISNKYENEEIILVGVLKGAVFFVTELARKINVKSLKLDFIKIKSYGNDVRESNGDIQFNLDISEDIENKHVIIVEDILDTGYSLKYLYSYLKKKNPKTLEICVLLDKWERRKVNVTANYIGFKIENKFVVGYGLDCDEKYRELSYIGYIEE